MRRSLFFILCLVLASCTASIPKESNRQVEPIKVIGDEMSRVSFKGVHYDIKAGTTIGERRWGNGSNYKKELEWTGQRNPNQFNTSIELLFKQYGYDVISYKDRVLNFKKSTESDLKIGFVIHHMYSEQRLSTSHRNRFHKVELGAKIKIRSDREDNEVYENNFNILAVDIAESRDEKVDALPRAIELLTLELLSDPSFVTYARKPN